MNTLAERLKHALGRNPGMTQLELAKACEVKAPSVADWLSGRTKKIEGANLLLAAKALNVNPWWLATGKGSVDGDMKTIFLDSPQKISGGWPFTVAIELFLSLPPDERERLDDDLTHAVERWHTKNHMKSKKAG